MKFWSFVLFLSVLLSEAKSQLTGNSLLHKEGPYEYVIPTIVMTTGNTAISVFNVYNLMHGNRNKSNAGWGLITGALQVGVATMYHDPEKDLYFILMSTDVVFGLATMAISTVRLCTKVKPQESKTTFHLNYLPKEGGRGSSFTVRVARTF